MKPILTCCAALLCSTLFLGGASAAPGVWSIAINTETGECGGFWPGDEDTRYRLPTGWTILGESDAGIGTCTSFDPHNAKPCCDELGLTFTENNVGIGGSGCDISSRTHPDTATPFAGITSSLLLLVLLVRRRPVVSS